MNKTADDDDSNEDTEESDTKTEEENSPVSPFKNRHRRMTVEMWKAISHYGIMKEKKKYKQER